jgi:rhamnosyltransferase
VLIAYNTSSEVLTATAAEITKDVERLIIVDNSDSVPVPSEMESLMVIPKVEYIALGKNFGIATAQNRGIERCIELGVDYILFLDDDSRFPSGGVMTMLQELEEESTEHPNTCGIGPRILDEPTGEELTYLWHGSDMVRREAASIVEVAFLVSSGALIEADAFSRYGNFRDDYFIDHVDKEWGYRVALQGGRLVVTPRVTMTHQLGDRPTKSIRGNVRFRHENPARDYYLSRNAIFVVRDLSMPRDKRIGMIKLLVTNSTRKVVGFNRTLDQRKAVIKGVYHGLLNLRGPLGSPRKYSQNSK